MSDAPVTRLQWFIALTLGVVLSVLSWHGLLRDHDLNGGDTWPYFMPQKVVLAESLQNNEIPVWHHHTGLGYPLLAESQAGVFYPTNQILYRWLDVNRAYYASIVLHYALAFVFAWRFVRSQKVSHGASLLAALIYVYGWFPARISLEWSIIGGVWLPLTLWITHEFLQRPGAKLFAALATSLGIHLLAGHFTLAFINQLCLVMYGLLRFLLAPAETRPQLRSVAMVPAAVLISLLIGAAQLLPSMELKQVSQREDGQKTQRAFDPGYGHMPPLYLSQLVASWTWWHTPEIRLQRRLLHLPGSISSDTNAVEAHFYLGLIPLCLIAISLFQRRKPAMVEIHRLWWIQGIAAVVYATGWLLPVTRYFPGFSYFMGPGRYTIVATLAGAILAGLALDRLARTPGRAILMAAVVGGLTWFDLGWSTRPIADAVQVPDIWSQRSDSWIREYFGSQPLHSTRLLSSGPNVANVFGTSAVPQYLGIGPAIYFSDAFDLATDPADDRFLSKEQLEKLQRLAVTHILIDQRLQEEDMVAAVKAGPDSLLNQIWGSPYTPRYLYALREPGQRLSTDPETALTAWKCTSVTSSSLTIDVELSAPATVILRDLMYPGWSAYIDGAAVKTVSTDPLVRQVAMSAGHHKLEWKFQSASVLGGMSVSVVSLLVLWAIALWPRRKQNESTS